MTTQFKTPVGTVLFMAHNKPAKGRKEGDKEYYQVKLMFSNLDPASTTVKKHAKTVSSRSVITSDAKDRIDRDSFAVVFKSLKKPVVLDSTGAVMETVPNFFGATDTAKATAIYSYMTRPDGSGALFLEAIQINELTIAERKSTGGPSLDDLRKLLAG